MSLPTSNHRLPFEKGRWSEIPLTNRLCPLWGTRDIGDEFHYLLMCPFFRQQKNMCILLYHRKYTNILILVFFPQKNKSIVKVL